MREVALFPDAQHRVIAAEELFRGTLTQTSVYPREVVKAALRRNAAAVILAHNHPSGVAQPSQADELLTRSLAEALALIEVKVLDHFIVAGNQTLSFAERGMAAFNQRSPQDILDFDVDDYFGKSQLIQHLSPTRGNGLKSMVGKIRAAAKAQL